MRSWRVIDTLNLEGDIVATRGGVQIEGTRVPLEEVSALLLGQRVRVTGAALSMLAKYEVVVINCDWRGVPNQVSYPWSGNTRVAARHIGQAALSEPRRKAAWKSIIRAKIYGQARNLKSLNRPQWKRLEVLRAEVKSGDTSNCEAQAARVYWEASAQAEDFRRVPRGADPLNSLFNYGYTVARGHMIRAICSAGLWPTLGLWHRNRENVFCLADDLIEPFRPVVDTAVFRLGDEADLQERGVKKALVECVSAPMGKAGRSALASMFDLASNFAQYVEGDVDRLAVPQWSGIELE